MLRDGAGLGKKGQRFLTLGGAEQQDLLRLLRADDRDDAGLGEEGEDFSLGAHLLGDL